MSPLGDGWTTREEKTTILDGDSSEGQYLKERGYRYHRTDHDRTFAPNEIGPWGSSDEGGRVDGLGMARVGGSRSVRVSDLRLLWGIAPLPRLKSTMFRNIPFATILRPHSSLDWDYSVKVPVSEYNVYFEAPKGGASVPSAVKRVVVIVEFVEAQSGLTTTPTELGSAVKVSTPHATGSRKAVICTSGPIQLEALLRTDRFSRFNLPNEPPEPLHLAP